MAEVRTAVREFLALARRHGHLDGGTVALACSGGADSLALAALTIALAHKEKLTVRCLVVDHRLQPDSPAVARRAAAQLDELGADEVRVLTVSVGVDGGPEAAARTARYAALREAAGLDRARSNAAPSNAARSNAAPSNALVLLGHTRDDQAETVLLGLGRGSGPRSIAGMRALDPPWGRPLLGVSRASTAAACAALGIEYWTDPHNADPRFTRVRLRHEVLPLLDDVLAGGVAAALARTAEQLRADVDLLDALGVELLDSATIDGGQLDGGQLDVSTLAAAPEPLRTRALRRWLLASGVPELTDAQIRAVQGLVTDWHGQGGVHLVGGLVARRAHGRLILDRPS